MKHAPDSVPNRPRRQPRRRARGLGVSALLAGLACASPLGARAAETAALCKAPGTPPGAPRLHVTVSGARRVAGNITFSLYGEDGALFLKHHGWIAQTRVTLTGPAAEACFAVSAPGTYAVAVFHDENDNHHFDTNLLGLPKEGYGFSNDAAISLGPPAFEAVRMTVQPGDNAVSIKLRY
jgi:uncharacterized protein (DUF2141 family)